MTKPTEHSFALIVIDEKGVARKASGTLTVTDLPDPNPEPEPDGDIIEVASAEEFDALDMAPASSGDMTIRLADDVTITKAAATAKICGTAASPRVLGGKLTLTGGRVEGLGSLYMEGGAFTLSNMWTGPEAGLPFEDSNTKSILRADYAPTTDVEFIGLHCVGHPDAVEWPGVTEGSGEPNDYDVDPWGALIKVNAVSGVARPYVDASWSDDEPDVWTFAVSKVKCVCMGIRDLGNGEFEAQISDKSGNFHGISDSACPGENKIRNIHIGDTITGLDGFEATVIAPPEGAKQYSSGGAGYGYIVKGPRWLDTPTVRAVESGGLGYINTCRNLTIRDCDVRGCNSVIHPYAIETTIVEQNKFSYFTDDCFKMRNYPGENFTFIVRRNDVYTSLHRMSDMGGPHQDYFQIFGDPGAYWPNFRFYHNRLLCNSRGCGQGMFNDNGGNALINGQLFGNIFVLENGGWMLAQNLSKNSIVAHNTFLVNQKHPGMPANWSPNSMLADPAGSDPNTGNYVGWNIARQYAGTAIKTEKNFGLGGNVSKTQLEMVAGLGGDRPLWIQTFEDMMEAARTILPGEDEKAGAVSSVTDWSGYPYYVTTDDTHLPVKLDYDPGKK